MKVIMITIFVSVIITEIQLLLHFLFLAEISVGSLTGVPRMERFNGIMNDLYNYTGSNKKGYSYF